MKADSSQAENALALSQHHPPQAWPIQVGDTGHPVLFALGPKARIEAVLF
jgi:predicted PhzF superfamily epimerase YddE/YHI9